MGCGGRGSWMMDRTIICPERAGDVVVGYGMMEKNNKPNFRLWLRGGTSRGMKKRVRICDVNFLAPRLWTYIALDFFGLASIWKPPTGISEGRQF
jgi:hypothetical protein